MKKLFVIAALALGVLGCSKTEMEDTDVFDWTDKDAIAPVSFDSEAGVDKFSWDACDETVPGLLEQNGITLSKHPGAGGIPWVGAVVINDEAVISDVVTKYGLDSNISGDLEEYSLIAGYALTGNTGGYKISQRVKLTIEGVSLGLLVEQVGFGWCTPGYAFYMALYPKLPSGPVSKIYRTDVDADPGSGGSAE